MTAAQALEQLIAEAADEITRVFKESVNHQARRKYLEFRLKEFAEALPSLALPEPEKATLTALKAGACNLSVLRKVVDGAISEWEPRAYGPVPNGYAGTITARLWTHLQTALNAAALPAPPPEKALQEMTAGRCLQHGDGCRNVDCRDSGRWVEDQSLALPEPRTWESGPEWEKLLNQPDVPGRERALSFLRIWANSYLANGVMWDIPQTMANALNSAIRLLEEPAALPEPENTQVWKIEVFSEADGQFAADYVTGDGREAGMGEYSATPIGALANLCATLIKVAEDKSKAASSDPSPAQPEKEG